MVEVAESKKSVYLRHEKCNTDSDNRGNNHNRLQSYNKHYQGNKKITKLTYYKL